MTPSVKKLLVFLVLLIVVVSGFALLNQDKISFPALKMPKFGKSSLEEKPLAKIGEETIYQRDLDHERAVHPIKNDEELKTVLLEKLLMDSAVLQAGAAEGLVELTPAIFNSLNKDYALRLAAIEQVVNAIAAQSQQSEGAYVAIWFMNNEPGALGYEAGQAKARQVITDVHAKVKSGELTIEEAGEEIAANESLRQVDPAFATNAYAAYSAGPNQPPTFDDNFNQIIMALQPGAVSEVVTITDKQLSTGEIRPALFAFAQVTNQVTDGPVSVDAWKAAQRARYAVTQY